MKWPHKSATSAGRKCQEVGVAVKTGGNENVHAHLSFTSQYTGLMSNF